MENRTGNSNEEQGLQPIGSRLSKIGSLQRRTATPAGKQPPPPPSSRITGTPRPEPQPSSSIGRQRGATGSGGRSKTGEIEVISETQSRSRDLIIPSASLLRLEKACQNQTDYQIINGEFVVVPAHWMPPKKVSPDVLESAYVELDALLSRLHQADQKNTKTWLKTLGTLCASKMTIEDAQMRLLAYVELLDHPEGCFTKATLAEAGRLFRWFPTFSEVAEFLDKKRDAMTRRKERLERIIDAGERKDEPVDTQPAQQELTPEERAVIEGSWVDAMKAGKQECTE